MSTHSLPTHLAEATAPMTDPVELEIHSSRRVMLPPPADRMETVKKSRANLAGNLTRIINKARDAIATNRSTRTLGSYHTREKEALHALLEMQDRFLQQVRSELEYQNAVHWMYNRDTIAKGTLRDLDVIINTGNRRAWTESSAPSIHSTEASIVSWSQSRRSSSDRQQLQLEAEQACLELEQTRRRAALERQERHVQAKAEEAKAELLAQEELEKAELRAKHFRGAMEEKYGAIPLPQTEPDALVSTWLGNHQGKQPEPVTCQPSGPWAQAVHPNVAARDTNPHPPKHWGPPPAEAFDAWIDRLVPGVETNIDVGQASSSDQLVQAIVKIESERDLPKVEVPVFEGAPLAWPRFVEQFQIQIHCRPGISDSRRMDMLQSHLEGEARLMVQDLGYSGRNYAQALQELKCAFGPRVKVARAYIEKVTAGPVIPSRDPQALRKFYVSVRDCITAA